MQYSTLLFDVRDGVAHVTLNRPDASNALDGEMGRELMVTALRCDEDLTEEAGALASQLAAGPTKALGASKQLLHSGWTETLETQMEHEARAIADIARTAGTHEGIAAFTEKRAASFEGR